MNNELQAFARQNLKDGLAQCTEAQILLFKRMHYHKNLNASIDEAVNGMEEDRLDCAMLQVQRTFF